jgi:hypothetical protein
MANGIVEPRTNHREIHARTFALDKAREVSGEIVQLVLDRTNATIPDLELIEDAAIHIQRRIAGLLKHSLMEFTDLYIAEMERRLDAMQRLQEDALNIRERG